MRSGWMLPRGSSSISMDISEMDSTTEGSSSCVASTSSRKWSSGALESFRTSFNGHRPRTTATPKERLFRSHKACSVCGAIGQIQSQCTSSQTQEDVMPNSPTFSAKPEPQWTESVLIYSSRQRKSAIPIPRAKPREAGANPRGDSPHRVLSSMASSPIIAPSMSSQSNRASPFSSSSFHSGFPESVTHSAPGVEFPEDFEEDGSVILHTEMAEQKMKHWNDFYSMDGLEEAVQELTGKDKSGTVADELARQRRSGNLASSFGSLSDWSDFEKYGIDVDLYVGQRGDSFSESTPLWDVFTRGNPEALLQLPNNPLFRETKSAVLQPRRWGSEDWGRRRRSSLHDPVSSNDERGIPRASSPSKTGWLSTLRARSRSREANLLPASGPLQPQSREWTQRASRKAAISMERRKEATAEKERGGAERQGSTVGQLPRPHQKKGRNGGETSSVVKSLKKWISRSPLGTPNRSHMV